MHCLSCGGPVDLKDAFCKHCGKKVQRSAAAMKAAKEGLPLPKPPYDNMHGWWKVTTEGDVEGRSTFDAAIHVYKRESEDVAGEVVANGQLIAAAPDLLAACERVLDAEWGNAHEKTLEIVRAAVSKALGEDNV